MIRTDCQNQSCFNAELLGLIKHRLATTKSNAFIQPKEPGVETVQPLDDLHLLTADCVGYMGAKKSDDNSSCNDNDKAGEEEVCS